VAGGGGSLDLINVSSQFIPKFSDSPGQFIVLAGLRRLSSRGNVCDQSG
jgi:hypothetical protein